MRISINKIQIYSVLFIIATTLLFIFLVSPTLADIKYNSDKILSNKSELVFTDRQSRAIEDFRAEYNSYQPNLLKVDQTLVDPKNPVRFVQFLETSSLESGVSLNLNIVNSSKKETINNLPAIPFNLNMKGDFGDILMFAEKLEKGPYLVKIQNLTMNKQLLESSNYQIEAELLIYVATK